MAGLGCHVCTNMSSLVELFNTHSSHLNATLGVGFIHEIHFYMRERHNTYMVQFLVICGFKGGGVLRIWDMYNLCDKCVDSIQ